jgi:hypothetical protein
MQQTVMVFADAAARTTALSGVVAEGMLSYLKDTNAVEVYNGSSWVASDDPNAIQNTIVDAKGDLITATGADTPARLAVGSNGDTLVADSAATTGLRWQGSFAAGKNKIINGDFNINQRAFSSVTANGTYTFDRFVTNFSGGTVTFTPQTFTPGAAPVSGYEATNFLQIVTSGQSASNYASIGQKIENVRTFAGQTVTLSFWAKATSGTPKIGWYALQNFGSGGSSAAAAYAGYTENLSSSWARYSITYAVPSISGKTIGTSSSFDNYLMVSDGAGTQGIQNNTFQIWGVQIENGSTATAFQTATGTIQGELAACQRYYWRATLAADCLTGFEGAAYSTTAVYGIMNAKVTMRTTPTSLDYSNVRITDALTNYTITNLALWNLGTENAIPLLATGASGLTQYRPYILGVTASGGYVGISAEL